MEQGPAHLAKQSAWRDRVCVAYLDEPPFFVPSSDSGTPTGCDIELIQHVLDELGVASVEFVLTTFSELIPGVRQGRWTINVPMFVTEARAELVDFSRPVWVAGDGFIVRNADAKRWTSYEAIADDPRATLAVVVAQIQEQTALRAGVPPERIISFPDQQTAVEAVRIGQADASASTAPGNRAYLHRAANPSLSFVPDTPSTSRAGLPVGAFSFAKTTPELTDAVNSSLDRYLGTKQHLEMMSRYGFTRRDLAPVL